MKKILVTFVIAAVVITVGVGAYAHYEGNSPLRGWGMYGQQAGIYGPRGGMGGHGWMHGWNPKGKGGTLSESCPCGGHWNWNAQQRLGGNAPGQSQTAPQLITEEKVKEVAETYIKQYLPGYTVDKIEKDAWRPFYIVTVKGENNAEMQMLIHGFGGQVMRLFPKTATE